MRIRVIACEVLFREICQCAARARSIIDLTLLRRGLHSNPDMLREELQHLLDGPWDSDRFLVVSPGHEIVPTVDVTVVRAEPASSSTEPSPG